MKEQDIKRSSSEWYLIEQNKRSELDELRVQKALIEAKRSDLLLDIGDSPNNKDLKKSLEDIEKNLHDSKIEIESVKALLEAIPRRRDLARANEIESQINEIDSSNGQLKDLAASVDQAAEEFVLMLLKYFDFVEGLHQMNPHIIPRGYGIGTSASDSIGYFLNKHNLWNWVRINAGDRRNAKSMVENLEVNPIRRLLNMLKRNMNKSSSRLKGEMIGELDVCSSCFGKINFDYSTGKKYCGQCGWTEGENIQNLQFVKQPVED